MFFSPRISTRELAGLCRRLSMSLDAGIDLRTVMAREAERARGHAMRSRMRQMSVAVNQGVSLPDALAETGDYFPPIFRDLVRVGDHTGHLSEAFSQLAEHYDYQVKLRRDFMGAIAWPMLQLTVAIFVVGFLIWILGAIGRSTGTTFDILGWGLTGERGLAIYALCVGTAIALVAVLIRAVQRGLGWTRPVQRVVLRVPGLGPALETMAVARLAWTLHLTLNAGMEIGKAVRLSLESTRNARYLDQIPSVDASIRRGNSLFDTFLETQAFTPDFLDTLRVGEQSGRLVESMGILSRQYRERAASALSTLTMIAGFAVWGLVAVIIIVLIFRIFSFYLGALQGAMP
jgi:type IV pilus assembly protein PilC